MGCCRRGLHFMYLLFKNSKNPAQELQMIKTMKALFDLDYLKKAAQNMSFPTGRIIL